MHATGLHAASLDFASDYVYGDHEEREDKEGVILVQETVRTQEPASIRMRLHSHSHGTGQGGGKQVSVDDW